ncbi:MAG: membrane-associated protein [Natronomonas sp.]|jgi:membrane-associated protein
MYTAAIEVGVGLLAQYGLLALLVVFALEGALVGKFIPTRTLFIAAVLAVGTDAVGVLSVFAAAVVGATAGQVVLFAFVRHSEATPEMFLGASAADDGRVSEWFDRWGLPAVVLSNAVPVVRGALTVPAAMTEENTLRFSAFSMVGTSVYASGLLAVAAGLDVLRVLV